MPVDITFTIGDDDVERFQRIVADAREALADPAQAARVEEAARRLLQDSSRKADMPGFISERLSKLEELIAMRDDEDWALPEAEKRNILGALAYLCQEDDLIADDTPGFGYLDDAIYVELVLRDLAQEIRLYEEFCRFREAETARRAAEGEATRVDREDWLAAKRKELHGKMRRRLPSYLKLW